MFCHVDWQIYIKIFSAVNRSANIAIQTFRIPNIVQPTIQTDVTDCLNGRPYIEAF